MTLIGLKHILAPFLFVFFFGCEIREALKKNYFFVTNVPLEGGGAEEVWHFSQKSGFF